MFDNFLDHYAHSNAIRNVNTYYKVSFGIITMIVSLVSTSPIIPLTIFVLVSFILLFKAEIPVKFYLKFLTVPLTFALSHLFLWPYFLERVNIFTILVFSTFQYLQMVLTEDF